MFESQTLFGKRYRRENTMAGKLIVFEGVDGIGKSSLSKEVTRRLTDSDVAFDSLAFPGNDPGTLGSLIYQLHHDPGALGLADLPSEIEAGLDPKQIAKMLGESLRQHFLRSGVQDTVSALQTTSAAMTSAQKELSAALRARCRIRMAALSRKWNALTIALSIHWRAGQKRWTLFCTSGRAICCAFGFPWWPELVC
jgi:hypothetical protein